MLRLFTSLYFGIIATFFVFVISVRLLEMYTVTDLDNILLSDRFTSEIQLLEQLVDNRDSASINTLLDDVATKNHFIIEPIARRDIAPEVLAELAHRKVWFDEDDYLYIKAFTPARFYQVSENEQSKLIGLIDTIDTYTILSIFVVFALMSLGWLWGLMKKLRHLEAITDKFSHGDFSARASMLGRHRVGRLNQRFNDMAQRISQLIAAQKQQTQMVAHELRSPLFRLHLQLDLLEQTEKDKQSEYIVGIEEDISRLEVLVDELLDYGKVCRAELTLNKQDIDIHEFVNNIYRQSVIDGSKQLLLSNQLPEAFTFYADQHYLARAMCNLVSNANKYAEKVIRLSVLVTQDHLIFKVEDDGRGVAENEREQIFLPYYRVQDQDNCHIKGYGLGLSICHEVARLHQGEIYVTTSELGGAEFVLTLLITAKN